MDDGTRTRCPSSAVLWIAGLAVALGGGCGGGGRGGAASTAAKSPPTPVAPIQTPSVPGTTLIVKAGDVEITRSLPAAAFTLAEGETLDPRLPPGPFEAQVVVTFDRGTHTEAYLGAEIRGGGLIVFREQDMLRSSYAEDEAKLIMTHQPVMLTKPRETIRFDFTADGPWPVQFRAMWQPMETSMPQDLPSDGHPLIDGDAMKGMQLAVERQCTACHQSDRADLQALLDPASAPNLSKVGGRIHPAWLRSWLTDPSAIDPEARMPQLFHGGDADAETIEDLTQFLASLGGPLAPDEGTASDATIAEGGRLFHELGCVACHGPLEPMSRIFGGSASAPEPARLYRSLQRLRGKTTAAALATYLRDPVSVHPDGRMPSMLLKADEAEAIAQYLLSRFPAPEPDTASVFTPDPQRIERGRAAFAKLGCANCHSAGADDLGGSALTAPSLESLADSAAATGGCLASPPPAHVPDFGLIDEERGRLRAFLAALPARKTDRVPIDELALTISRLNCTACHAFHAASGPEPAIEPYFRSNAKIDLGREDRMPPNLTLAGARLRPEWIKQVLEDAARARPYMITRMPQFGQANVDRLPACFTAAGGEAPVPKKPTSGPPENADDVGATLIGVRGLNCRLCHAFQGQPGMVMPGPDLALMPRRLRYDWFTRWVTDPKSIRPDTRMPNFFVAGHSGATQFYDGRAVDQVRAIWAYLASLSTPAAGGETQGRPGGD